MSLRVDLSGNGTGFQQMLNTAKAQANRFAFDVSRDVGASWGGVGKSLAAGFAGMMTYQGISAIVGKVTGKVSELRELSDQLGTTDVESIQKWGKAFERVGGTVSKMTTLASQMNEKRNAAMGHDLAAIKTRQQLEGMGITADEINPESGLNSLDFMQKAFHFANQSQSNASQFDDVFGAKASRFAGAEKYVAEAKAPIDSETFETMKETEEALHKFGEAVEMATGKLLALVTWSIGKNVLAESMANNKASNALHQKVNEIRDKGDAATPFEKAWLSRVVNHNTDIAPMSAKNSAPLVSELVETALVSALKLKPSLPKGQQIQGSRKPVISDEGTINTTAIPVTTKAAAPEVDEDLKAQREEWAKQETEARIGLHGAQGGMMTIGDRRKLILADIQAQHNETTTIQGKLDSPTYGLSKGAFGKLTDVDKEELKHKLTMELIGSQTKEQSLLDKTKEKPLAFGADSMSKVGLYSASNVAFNPLLGVQQKQLTIQEKILARINGRSGGNLNDPYSP